MALVPGTLPSNQTFPGTPQDLLNLFSQYLSAPPAQKSVFVQSTSAGIPTDGSAIWYNTSSNANQILVYSNGAWTAPTVLTSSVTGTATDNSVNTNAIVGLAVNNSKIANATIQPSKLYTGAPSWDTNGNLTTYGTGGIVTSGNITASGSISATGVVSATSFSGSGANLSGIASVPTGVVLPFAYAMSGAPSGWLICDGTQYLQASYPALFGLIGRTYNPSADSGKFAVPNLQGLFIRGAGIQTINSVAYTAGAIATPQADQFQGHQHRIQTQINASVNGTVSSGGAGVIGTYNTSATISDGSNGSPRSGTETRPANLAMVYCIKT